MYLKLSYRATCRWMKIHTCASDRIPLHTNSEYCYQNTFCDVSKHTIPCWSDILLTCQQIHVRRHYTFLHFVVCSMPTLCRNLRSMAAIMKNQDISGISVCHQLVKSVADVGSCGLRVALVRVDHHNHVLANTSRPKLANRHGKSKVNMVSQNAAGRNAALRSGRAIPVSHKYFLNTSI